MLSVVPALAAEGETITPPGPVGQYFSKKQYVTEPLPTLIESRDKLPNPILSDRPELVSMYWKCWELGFTNLHQPSQGSPLVSNWIDAAFNQSIFQWDTIFMVMFARYGCAVHFPAVGSLDNFYCRQHADGYICRQIRRGDGADAYFRGPINSVNPPLFSWAEVESYRVTGNKSRFAAVLPVLEKYVEWLNREGEQTGAAGSDWESFGRRAAGSVHHLYWNTPLGSGMDNTPRKGNGWVDMSCQMVIQYNDLAFICDELGQGQKAAEFRAEAKSIGERINRWCWNETDGFYYDVDNDGVQFKVKTSGGFWPMLAGIASKAQCDRLIEHLKNPAEFWRPDVFPTLAANEQQYNKMGGYWHGAVWAPTNFAIIKGLEQNGYEEFATEATDRYLSAMARVYQTTGTVWENYSAEFDKPGIPAKRDFVGWTGDGPIALLIENILGFRADGAHARLEWRLTRTDRNGIERLPVGDALVLAICGARKTTTDPATITVTTDKQIELKVRTAGGEKTLELRPGTTTCSVP
jgi:glycogen debranching enzyme